MSNQFDPIVKVQYPGAWFAVHDNAVNTTGLAFVTAGVVLGGGPLSNGWVRVVNRSTSGNLLFGPSSALAIVGIPPGTVQDVLAATSWQDVFLGVDGSLWLKASTGTVRASILVL